MRKSESPNQSDSKDSEPQRVRRGDRNHGKRAKVGEHNPRPELNIFTTTLWEYPSQHYTSKSGLTEQGDKDYIGATPSWIIWQLLQRYTRENDLVVDPMSGSGTTLDVARDLGRRGQGFDLNPTDDRDDIARADARKLPIKDASADFVFIDPPYSTHIDYSDDPNCIGKLDAGGPEYYRAMEKVIVEAHRILKNRRYFALYVSDSYKKKKDAEAKGGGGFMPIGFELFSIMRKYFEPIDIIAVVRHNTKLGKANWHKAAREENFFLRGFNYLFVMKKVET